MTSILRVGLARSIYAVPRFIRLVVVTMRRLDRFFNGALRKRRSCLRPDFRSFQNRRPSILGMQFRHGRFFHGTLPGILGRR